MGEWQVVEIMGEEIKEKKLRALRSAEWIGCLRGWGKVNK